MATLEVSCYLHHLFSLSSSVRLLSTSLVIADVKQGERGKYEEDLCHCCRSGRAHSGNDTAIKNEKPVNSFPYYPSLQERHIFKYLFVDTRFMMHWLPEPVGDD